MNLVKDFIRYMDTTYPCGVDRAKYTDLKYSNRERVNNFLEENKEIDMMLLEKVALKELLSNPESTVVEKCREYMEE